MPMYDYRCEECGAAFDAIVRVDERDSVDCPDCGSPTERLVSGFAIGGSAPGGDPVAGGGGRCYTGG